MLIRSLGRALALALVALAAATPAQAAFSYTTAIVINSVGGTGGTIVNTPGTGSTFTSTGGTTVALSNVSGSLFLTTSPLTANIGNITLNTSSSTPDTFTVNYTNTITVTNPSPGGPTGTFTINGTLTFSNVQFVGGASGGASSNLYSGTFTQTQAIGPNNFTANFGSGMVNDFYGPPTINGAGGNLGAQITPTAVPEPASLAMLGLGLAGLVGVRRARASAR